MRDPDPDNPLLAKDELRNRMTDEAEAVAKFLVAEAMKRSAIHIFDPEDKVSTY